MASKLMQDILGCSNSASELEAGLKRATETMFSDHGASEYGQFETISQRLRVQVCHLEKANEELRYELNKKEILPPEEFRALRAKIHELQQTMFEQDGEHSPFGIQKRKFQKENLPFNLELLNFMDATERKYLMLKEQLRQEQENTAKAKKDHLKTTSENQQTILELSQKLNNLQPRRCVLYDEQCTAEWRGLRRKLENWVSKSFGNAAILNTMTSDLLISKGQSKVTPQKYLETSVHTRRAYIQSYISRFILDEILSVSFVQVPDVQVSQAFHTMAQYVKSKGDRQLWEQWSSSTNTALECFSKSGFLLGKLDNLLHTVDFYYGEFYNNNMSRKLVHDKLSEVFWDCVGFKTKLEREDSDYQFEYSNQGKPYSKENMNSTNSETRKGAVVQLSLWPAISKTSLNDERMLLEHEAVWTSPKAATIQNAEAGLRGKESLFQKAQQLDVDMKDGDSETDTCIL